MVLEQTNEKNCDLERAETNKWDLEWTKKLKKYDPVLDTPPSPPPSPSLRSIAIRVARSRESLRELICDF